LSVATVLPAAGGILQLRPKAGPPPVLRPELDVEPAVPFADVGRVGEESFLAALHRQKDPGDRRVGDRFKGGADAAVVGVDAGDGDDLDLTAQVQDEVGQRVA
jgi:hypothetical protein